MTVSIPAIWRRGFWQYEELGGGLTSRGKREKVEDDGRGVGGGTMMDFVVVMWPAVALWCLFTWWTML